MRIARVIRRGRIWVSLGLTAPFITFCNLPGGEDPCVRDQHCDGSVAFSCREDIEEGRSSWTRYAEDCSASGRVCLEQGDRHVPICVLSKDPDPRCSAQRMFCDGDRVLTCSSGYVVDAKDCSKEGRTCANPGLGDPVCAASNEPDARCMGGTAFHCDGTTLILCDRGFVTSETPCNHDCVEPTASSPFCAPSAVKDPSCTLHPFTSYCRGNSEIFCQGEYAAESWDCPVCTPLLVGAACFGLDGQEIHEKPKARAQDGG